MNIIDRYLSIIFMTNLIGQLETMNDNRMFARPSPAVHPIISRRGEGQLLDYIEHCVGAGARAATVRVAIDSGLQRFHNFLQSKSVNRRA